MNRQANLSHSFGILLTGLLFLLTALLPAAAVAQGPAPGVCGPPVEITVRTVLATKRPQAPDPALASLAPLLGKAFGGYQGFSLLNTSTWQTQDSRVQAVALPNGQELRIAYQGFDAAHVKLELSIPPRLSTAVRVTDGGTFFQAGMNHGAGILVRAVTAGRRPPLAPDQEARPLPATAAPGR